jgi:radical SAM superfamily enzyme YgiQ (UPF0313 family)
VKITFILPGIGKKKGMRYTKSWKTFPPLAFAIIKSLTPPEIQTEFFDDRLELVDFVTKTDLVAITAEAFTALRAYQIADAFRNRGIPVIIGGSQATFLPDEVAQHADSVFIGNVESTWNLVLDDFMSKNLKEKYYGTPGFSSIMPDYSIFKGKKYAPVGIVETGRGCFFDCQICCISSYYNRKYYPRPIADIVKEIKQLGYKYYFLHDDNIVASPNFALELFKAIEPLKIKWIGQVPITIGKNYELLKWAKRSGCTELFIGFETLEYESLKQINKQWNFDMGDVDQCIKNINKAGISIYGSFVFGFDFDTIESIQKIVDFSNKHALHQAGYNILLPYPGSAIYGHLKVDNRLTMPQWWLSGDYRYGDVPFKPKLMAADDLKKAAFLARKDFYKFSSIIKRIFKYIFTNRDLILFFITIRSYLFLYKEVERKFNTPIGMNMDELPK